MAAITVQILEPANGARIAGTAPVRLRGQVVGTGTGGLFFKWYSTLNRVTGSAPPELNATDHSAAKLDWTTTLEVGTHVLTLAAADQESSALPAVKAITRAGFAGGAPDPANPAPCLVHRLWADLIAPAAGATVSRASAQLVVRAPARWGKPASPGSSTYVKDPDYHAVNGIRYRFRFVPAAADPAREATLTPAVDAFTFFIGSGDVPSLRWQGALPANLGNGSYTLTLFVESLDGAVSHSVARSIILVP
jgi:hypothetical protein